LVPPSSRKDAIRKMFEEASLRSTEAVLAVVKAPAREIASVAAFPSATPPLKVASPVTVIVEVRVAAAICTAPIVTALVPKLKFWLDVDTTAAIANVSVVASPSSTLPSRVVAPVTVKVSLIVVASASVIAVVEAANLLPGPVSVPVESDKSKFTAAAADLTVPLKVTVSAVASPNATSPFRVVAPVTVADASDTAPIVTADVPKLTLAFVLVVIAAFTVTVSVARLPSAISPLNVASPATSRAPLRDIVPVPEIVLVP